jgi:DNA sulfur modification protein DndE
MPLSLVDIVRTEFRTSRAADEMNTRLQGLLGLPHRYGPARLAIGRSLGQQSRPTLELNTLGLGKPIKGEHLFGQGGELSTWITLLVQHSGSEELTRRELQNEVAAHWHRGLYLLWDDWRTSASDFDAFVSRLVRHAGNAGVRKQAFSPA